MTTRRRHVAVVVLASLVLAGAGCKKDAEGDSTADGAVETPATATGSEGPRSYRILDGQITYSGQSTRSCTYPAGECHDYDGGYREASAKDERSIDATFSVRTPTEPSGGSSETVLEAPLAIDNWTHGYTYNRRMSHTPCNVPEAVTATDGNLRHHGDATAAVAVTPGAELRDMTVALRPMATPPSTVTETWVTAGGCPPTTTTTERSIHGRSPFDFYPDAERTRRDVAPTYTPRDCTETRCIVRAAGTDGWTYQGPIQGETLTGAMAIRWWFDIEIVRGEAICDGHYSTVEYGAGIAFERDADYSFLGDAFAFAASVKWCSDGNKVELRGQPDGTRFLFPDGTNGASAITVPLESLLGIEFQEKSGDLSTSSERSGSNLVVTVDSPGFEACASPLDILLAAPTLKAAVSSKWAGLTSKEREALLRNTAAMFSLPSSWLAKMSPVAADVVNKLFLMLLTSGATTIAGMSLEQLDDASDICVDVWDPIVTFDLAPNGTAASTVDVKVDAGVSGTTHERSPLETSA